MFTPPTPMELGDLPDSAVFVLRAIIQLEWASIESIIAATILGRSAVDNTVRYALSRSYIERQDDRYRVRWDWYRAVTVFLERRHLLVGKGE